MCTRPGGLSGRGRVQDKLFQNRSAPRVPPLGQLCLQALAPLADQQRGPGLLASTWAIPAPAGVAWAPAPPPRPVPARLHSLPGPQEHSIHSTLQQAGGSREGPGSRRRRGDAGERGRCGRASLGTRPRGQEAHPRPHPLRPRRRRRVDFGPGAALNPGVGDGPGGGSCGPLLPGEGPGRDRGSDCARGCLCGQGLGQGLVAASGSAQSQTQGQPGSAPGDPPEERSLAVGSLPFSGMS